MNTYLTCDEIEHGSNMIMLCGAPGSGKSTAANYIYETEDGYWTIVSPEQIREDLTGKKNDQSRNVEVFDIVHTQIRKNIENGMNVIYDATNCNYRTRKKIISTFRKSSRANKLVCLISPARLRACLNNNAERGEDRIVPEDVIERMYSRLHSDPPTLFEGFDAIGYFGNAI